MVALVRYVLALMFCSALLSSSAVQAQTSGQWKEKAFEAHDGLGKVYDTTVSGVCRKAKAALAGYNGLEFKRAVPYPDNERFFCVRKRIPIKALLPIRFAWSFRTSTA